MRKLLALMVLFVGVSAFADCSYVLEDGKYVWKCDPDPGSTGCRYIYQCGGSTPSGCSYVWDGSKYVLKCGDGTDSCQYVWTCG